MLEITGLDYLKMSKHDIYVEYCKVYEEYEKNIKKEIERLKAELNDARVEVMIACLTQPKERK